MQVRVNPNWSFKRVTRVTRAWLMPGSANRPFKRAKILNTKKKGGMNKPPKVHLT